MNRMGYNFTFTDDGTIVCYGENVDFDLLMELRRIFRKHYPDGRVKTEQVAPWQKKSAPTVTKMTAVAKPVVKQEKTRSNEKPPSEQTSLL